MSSHNNKIDITALLKDAMSMDHFELKYRFTDEDYRVLPQEDLNNILPLNEQGESRVYRLMEQLRVRKGYTLNENYFTSIAELNLKTESKSEITQWLDDIKIPPNRNIILAWDTYGVVITKWEIFVKYYEDFFYPVSDDVTIFDESLNWALFIYHDEIMFLGRNDDIVLNITKQSLHP